MLLLADLIRPMDLYEPYIFGRCPYVGLLTSRIFTQSAYRLLVRKERMIS